MSRSIAPALSDRLGLFIDGGWRDAVSWRETVDRWSGESTGRVAVATAADAVQAVDAASRAMTAPFAVPDRARVLRRAAHLLEDCAEDMAQLITSETGKPITAARGEVARGVETLRTSGEEARRLPSETVPLDAVAAGEGTLAFTIPVPRGVVAAVTPFNFPLNLLLHKVGPAIAAGCAVVVKPSDHAPRTAAAVAALLHEAGLPAGRLAIVTGPAVEIVGALQADDRVAVVTFTGSSEVGWRLKADAPRKHHVLELGSNTAVVIAADADVDRAARAAADAALGNSGQACVSLQRVYVHRDVAERFTAALTEAVAAAPVGDPRSDDTVVGPLIADTAAERLVGWIERARARGARVLMGGEAERGILRPTVVADVRPDDPLVCEEAFGPVVSVVTVADLDEAIAAVNASRYGLNTAVYTGDLATAMRYAREAEAGSVLVNMPPSFRADHMPYGGVKDSGEGREGVKYAIADLVRQRLVVLHA